MLYLSTVFHRHKFCEENLARSCVRAEQACYNLFTTLLQLLRFYVCIYIYISDCYLALYLGSEENQQKLYGNILLIGGGFMFNGALSKLQERLKAKLLNRKQPKLAESVEVMAKSRVRLLKVSLYSLSAIYIHH